MKNREFTEAEIEVILLSETDIIATSGEKDIVLDEEDIILPKRK